MGPIKNAQNVAHFFGAEELFSLFGPLMPLFIGFVSFWDRIHIYIQEVAMLKRRREKEQE